MAEIYPFKKYNYSIEIDGISVAGFSEVSAPELSTDPVEYREGNFAKNTVGKQSGLFKYADITLKWGITDNMELYTWIKSVEDGTLERKTVNIILNNDVQEEVAKWTVVEAWPIKYTATDFKATDKEAAIETLVLAHEGVTREK